MVNLRTEIDRGARAKALLEDELLQGAFESLRQQYRDLLENTESEEARNFYWMEMRGMKRFYSQLIEWIETGEMAKIQANVNKKAN